jgi:hypothetical protein
MDRLQAALEAERQDRQQEVAELERRNVAAKDKLKTEMFDKIKETKTVRVWCALCRFLLLSVSAGGLCALFAVDRASCWPPATSCTTRPSELWLKTSKSRRS